MPRGGKEQKLEEKLQIKIHLQFLKKQTYFCISERNRPGTTAEAKNGYSLEEALIVIDPYTVATPLTAVAVFSTEEEVGGTVTVRANHQKMISQVRLMRPKIILSRFGLYNGDTQPVEFTLDSGIPL